MSTKVITITNPVLIAKIKRLLAFKEYVHAMIRSGRVKEIDLNYPGNE